MASGNANALYLKALASFATAGIDLGANTIKALIFDTADVGAACRAVTAASNATPIVVTCTAHGWANGDWVIIAGITGNTNADGVFKIANQATNTFELTDPITGANIAGNGVFGGTAFAMNLSAPQFVADLAAAGIVARSGALASKTTTLGVFDAADITLTAVTGDPCEVVIVYKDTGADATSNLIAVFGTGTGLPVTPNGGDITIQWDNGNFRIFML
jgi:hypothetical protein